MIAASGKVLSECIRTVMNVGHGRQARRTGDITTVPKVWVINPIILENPSLSTQSFGKGPCVISAKRSPMKAIKANAAVSINVIVILAGNGEIKETSRRMQEQMTR